MTQTHTSIAVYRNDGRVYFAQAIARKIESGLFTTRDQKSKAWGSKGTVLTNVYRTSLGQPEILWSDTLHQICMEHSTAMGEGTVPFGHDNFDYRWDLIVKRMTGATGVAENVAYNQVAPTSDAVDEAIR